MLTKNSFASDNFAGIHPQVLDAIVASNTGHAKAYGGDAYTAQAIGHLKRHFGENIDVYFVFNGTGANVLGLKSIMASHEAIICASTAHINVDECGAPEATIGCKLIDLPTTNGKLTVDQVKPLIHGFGNEHHVQPKVISISQSTELGTVYTPDEILALSSLAHQNNMLLHMDGARLSNAAASLGLSLKEITADVGVDVLSFGGTKNGMMLGEAVIFFGQHSSEQFKFMRKQNMQLCSKMRFISAQFTALLEGALWRENAAHANNMAKLLERKLKADFPNMPIMYPVESNALFVQIPASMIEELQKESFFWVWDFHQSIVRWMMSWDTTEEDINRFCEKLCQNGYL